MELPSAKLSPVIDSRNPSPGWRALLFPRQILQKPQVIPLTLQYHIREQHGKRFQIAAVPLARGGQILPPQYRRNDGYRITFLQESQIHQQAGGSAIAIYIRVNSDQTEVKPCRKFDGMFTGSHNWHLCGKLSHQIFQVTWWRKNKVRPGDNNVLPAAVPGVVLIKAIVEQPVQLQNIRFKDSLALHQRL